MKMVLMVCFCLVLRCATMRRCRCLGWCLATDNVARVGCRFRGYRPRRQRQASRSSCLIANSKFYSLCCLLICWASRQNWICCLAICWSTSKAPTICSTSTNLTLTVDGLGSVASAERKWVSVSSCSLQMSPSILIPVVGVIWIVLMVLIG